MNLNLVGGFLGSGKTTSIIAAAKLLVAQGKRVGVVTNDQGKYLVDTAFFRLANMPTVEVTSGCFCCNYDDLDARLDQLIAQVHPDVIFAESVGSCADIVATVIKPLLQLRQAKTAPTSFSVFTDCRLLKNRLLGVPMPFNDDVMYIFDKQIEEASLLVVNKVDLLKEKDRQEVVDLVQPAFPGKTILFQSSLVPGDISHWVDLLESHSVALPQQSLEIDYDRYGKGEAELAWLDEKITLAVPAGEGRGEIIRVIGEIVSQVRRQALAVGHLKFLVQSSSAKTKISFASLEQSDWEKEIPALDGDRVNLMINARVETQSQELHELVDAAVERTLAGSASRRLQSEVMAFHPGMPRPTHRMK